MNIAPAESPENPTPEPEAPTAPPPPDLPESPGAVSGPVDPEDVGRNFRPASNPPETPTAKTRSEDVFGDFWGA